jgi:hypothetical protein
MSTLYVKKPIPIKAIRQDKAFSVNTLEGVMKGKAGDYLITGIKGEQYPCDADIFHESYKAYDPNAVTATARAMVQLIRTIDTLGVDKLPKSLVEAVSILASQLTDEELEECIQAADDI